MMLSASLPPDNGMLPGLLNHTLTEEQMQSLGLVSMQWQGGNIYAKAGEWILTLQGHQPALRYTPEGEPIFDPTLKGTSATEPAGEHRAFFQKMGNGVEFQQYLGNEDYILIKAPRDIVYEQLRDTVVTLPNFVAVEPNVMGGVAAVPNDPMFSSLQGLHNTGQTGGTPDADIDAPEAWDRTQGWTGAVVGVIDSGVDYTHADLAPNIWINPGEINGNGIDDDGNGYVDDYRGYDFTGANDSNPMDDYWHGTHVAGTIAAVGNNGTGVTGVAWQAKIMAIKWIDQYGYGSITDAIEAVNYAQVMRSRGVNIRVTNNSWYNYEGFSQAMQNAIQANAKVGVLFVAAAGNFSSNNDQTALYPACYPNDNIIAVAAVNSKDTLAYYSNWGATTVDLAAPGGSPLAGDGGQILSTLRLGTYAYSYGTSMAAPHVSGVGAGCVVTLWIARG
jgi:subtilisin family serine protease